MKTKRKLLSVLMTLAMVVSLIPAFGVTVSAVSPLPGFQLSSDGILSWNQVEAKNLNRYYIKGIYDNKGSKVYINKEGYERGFLQDCILLWSQDQVRFDLKTFFEKEYADGKDISSGDHTLVITAASGFEELPYESKINYHFIPVTSGTFSVGINGGTADKISVAEGETVTIKADQKEGYTFSYWSVDSGDVTLKDSNSSQTSFVMGIRNVSITAHFTKHFNIIVEGGTADKITSEGESVTITASLSAGQSFERWEVDTPGVELEDKFEKTTTIYLGMVEPGDVIIKAIKSESEAPDDPIQITTQPASQTVKKGDIVTLSVSAAGGSPGAFLGYMWDSSSDNGTTWENVGMGSPVLKFEAKKEDDGKLYRCKVFTNIESDGEIYSESAKLTVFIDEASLMNPFEDIYTTDEYYDAVLWAYYASPQVTNGMDTTHFGPQLTVTRGQAVTFLWRSMGCPEPSSTYNPFVDVPSTEYFYKPILWAVEKGITKGVDDTHFNPMDTLSTQHIITFLYRTKNPGMDGWNGEAAAWAADSNGKPFGVDIAVNNTTPCPRCNVVQFLYKLSK